MEPFDHLNQYGHHIVAIYPSSKEAEAAVNTLREAGVPDEHFSILIQSGDEQPPTEDDDDKTRGVVAGTATGGAIGFALGALVFGLPGVGTVIGAGIWTATIAGAALGAATGIEVSDYHHAWEGPYRVAVASGNTLVAVSTDDALMAAQAMDEFDSTGAIQVDHFDRHGTAMTPAATSADD